MVIGTAAPELNIVKLYTEELFPVCSPKLLQGSHPLLCPDDLTHHTLLHLDDRHDWSKWLDTANVGNADPSRGLVINQASNIIDAAVDGQRSGTGAHLGLAARDLICGRLVRPFSVSLPVSYAYWIVCPKTTAKLPKIEAFRDWLITEALDDQRQLAKITPADCG